MKLLIIIRGLPGSGKTTLAHKLSEHVFEADHYFVSVVDGIEQYNFDPTQIREAHEHCFSSTRAALEAGHSPVAVANTFCQYWQYSDYLDIAKQYDYTVQIIHVTGPWKNIHGCPSSTIDAMRKQWQPPFLSELEYHKWLFGQTAQEIRMQS